MKLVIIGAGGHGRVILDILSYLPDIEVVGFLDDNLELLDKKVNGKLILGSIQDALRLREKLKIEAAVIAIGDNKIRAGLFERFRTDGFKMPCAIHPKSIISSTVKMGEGVVVMPGVVINTNTVIGNNVCINTAAILDHDNLIDDHAHIYPGANLAGGVKVGKFSYIGTNAAVNPYLSIGEDSIIGSGAVVTKDIPWYVVAVGVPAKVIKYRNKEE